MKKALILAITLASALFLTYSPAMAGNGKALFKQKLCMNCHGANGHSKTPQYPHLAGQNKLYLLNQFNAIVHGQRKLGSTVLMANHPKLKGFSPQDIDDITTYLASLPRKASDVHAPAALVSKGEALFKNLGCTKCHGDGGQGKGNDPKFAAYPKLNGQHAEYLFWQMKRIIEGKRTNNHALKMRETFKAEKLNDAEFKAIAAYLSSVE